MKRTIEDFEKSLLKALRDNPAEIASIVESLRENTAHEGLITPGNEDAGWKTWGSVSRLLSQMGLRQQGADVALAWYDRICELQIPSQRFHKGGPAYMAAIRFLELGEQQRAFWFCTLAFIEDSLKTPEGIPQAPANQTLRLHFRQNEQTLGMIAAKAQEYRQASEQHWHYPEAVAIELARERKLVPPFTKSETDIPINRVFLKQLVNDLEIGGTKRKGNALEFIASYLAVTLPCVMIKPNVKTFEWWGTFEHELDLVVTQYSTESTYLLEALGRHFLIECKNWDKSVGAGPLNHFVAKMRFHHCKCGLIFSKNGLSGDDDLKAQGGAKFARLTQLRWYHQDDCVVIVVARRQLEQIANGSLNFSQALLQGYESVRFSSMEEE